MIYTVEELNRISGSRLAVNGRIYLDNKGNKYKGTVNGRIEQINISDRNVNIKLEVDDTPQSLKNFLVNLKNFTESSIELLKNLLSNKQDRLISGENIKTINNESLLGSGNIIISGSSYDGDPTIIDQDSDHRFVTDTEKSTWNSKANGTHNHAISDVTNLQTSLDDKANTLHTHSISDVTGLQTALDGKAASSHGHSISDVTNLQTSLDAKQATLVSGTNIKSINGESVLGSGNLTVSGGGYTLTVQALTSTPADGATIYFGQLPKAPVTTANISKVYFPKNGTIKRAYIYCYSGTAGTAENWSCYIRLNNTTDTLVQTVGVNTNERIFKNESLSISVTTSDYFEIKMINPTWPTNPATTIFGGYIYIE